MATNVVEFKHLPLEEQYKRASAPVKEVIGLVHDLLCDLDMYSTDTKIEALELYLTDLKLNN